MNKSGFVTIESNKYVLSPMLSGETIQAKIFFDHVEFFHDHHPVGNYRRSYKTNDEVFDWTQYVSVLCKKPGAIEHTRFFRQMPQQCQTFLEQTQKLNEIISDGNVALCNDTLELAGENGRTDADSFRQCYYMIAKEEYQPDPLKLPRSTSLHYNPNLSAYNGLMGGDTNV